MSSWSWHEWALRIAGGLMIAAGIGMALWAMWGDRARGRKRCPKCWYDMSGTAAREENGRGVFTCPECGKRTDSEHGLARTRRRWRLATAFVLLACLGWQVGWIGTPGREGLKAFVPTAALIALERDFAEAQKSKRMLWTRLAGGIVTPWDRWAASMRELHARNVDWDGMVWRREKWPVDRPMRIHIRNSWQHQSAFESRTVEMWWKQDPKQVAVVHMTANYIRSGIVSSRPPDYVDLPPPALGANRYELRLRVRGQHGGQRGERVMIEVEGVQSLDEAVLPDRSAAVASEIALKLGWRVEFGGNEAAIVLRMPENWFSPWRRVSMASHARLYRNEELIAEGVEYPYSGPNSRLSIWKWIPGTSAEGPETIDLTDLWVELTPRPEPALMDFYTSAYWAGSLRMRLTDLPVFGGEYGAQTLHDASAVKLMPGDPMGYRQFVEKLPVYTRRAIPLRPATGGKMGAEDGKE